MYENLSDEELLALIRNRDQQALAEIYDRYSSLVYGMALKVLQNVAFAQEITQDVFMKLWSKSERFDSSKGKFTSWLLTVTRNASIDRIRREQKHNPEALFADFGDRLRDEISSPHLISALERTILINSMLKRLPPEQRQVIELAFFRGCTQQEIANRLGIPLGTVKTRMRLGMAKLREMWKRESA